jgi:hypothetical protein
VLIGAAIIPSRAGGVTPRRCSSSPCKASGSVLWTAQLSGSWVAEDGVSGTVPAAGQAFAASAGGMAVLGYGTTVSGYEATTGRRIWQNTLTRFPLGAAIVSIRAWPAVVAVGLSVPEGLSGSARDEVILSAATGRALRTFPSAGYGGAVLADAERTVIVGAQRVTSYSTATGRVIWRLPTGPVGQAWAVAGRSIYVTESRGGYVSSSPVTGLRVIDLRSGAERLIRPGNGAFSGTLAGVVGDVVLFSGSGGLWGYSTRTGELRWHHDAAVLELVDAGTQTAYVATGTTLTALSTVTGAPEGSPSPSISAGLYAVRDGVALGLDQNNFGDAWGYDMATRKVVWTSAALPWPHFFADLTELGGSAAADRAVTLLTSCAQTGSSPGNAAPAPCLRPELDAIKY